MKIEIKDKSIMALREALQGSSLEPYCYLVGGSVRDLLLGREVTDYDICVELPQGDQQLAEYLYANRICSSPQKFKKHGLITCRINKHTLEMSQTSKNHQRGATASEELFGDLLEDALSRDFTINSLYLKLSDLRILDPTGRGLEDLAGLKLVSIKTPLLCFTDDPLRMMRALRFCVNLDMQIAPDMMQCITNNASLIQQIPKERVSDEFKRLLGEHRAASLQKLMKSGLMQALSPCLHCSLERLEQDMGIGESLFNDPLAVGDYLSTIMLLFWLGLRYSASSVNAPSHLDDACRKVKSSLAALEGVLILSNREKSLLTEIGIAYLYLLAKSSKPFCDLPDLAYLSNILGPQLTHLSQMLQWGKISKHHETNVDEIQEEISLASYASISSIFPYDGKHIIPLLTKQEYKYTGLILLLLQLLWLQNNGLNSATLEKQIKALMANPNLSEARKLYCSAPSKTAILWHFAAFKRYQLIDQTSYLEHK
ncbi:MAG: hypothetical protein RBR69_10305 [Candidatus Cloacimonadaceae bacterium]|nr:hypothetical protein [Candidatus Cloacimonadota bacterium]MCB5255853.1 hypothetical protein [Candidatus Cloacimonadota bacterium]MCK9242077.1 hypothetical protein [Candidatus Cloacimonadota bacterium]MDD3102724.1 hypothetical protein [Candidatus Cloacimonadota bacterium]MDY0128511.1 hypothetical protein [Candidatus Cloacimonadaceae bacterium]